MDSLHKEIKVLLVCLGNICRSPLAEGIFKQLVKLNQLDGFFYLDSAGTSDYHVGASPDQRAHEVAADYGVELVHKARQFIRADFQLFDYILVMDHLNYDAVLSLAQSNGEQYKVFLLRSFDKQSADYYDVPDPYYGCAEDFLEISTILQRSIEGFLNFLTEEGKLPRQF